MTLADTIRDRKKEIQQLVASNNLQKALKRLMDFCTDFSDHNQDRKTVLQLNRDLANQQESTEIAAQSLLLLDQVCDRLFN